MSRSSAKRHERTRARQVAVQLLYQEDLTDTSAVEAAREGDTIFDEGPVPAYAAKLLEGVSEHLDRIDEKISGASTNWSLDRMSVVDRAIMRMAVYEMLYEDDVPVSVSINEAVELAKRFGGEDESPRFTNGVLGEIAREQGVVDPKDAAENASDDGSDEGEAAGCGSDADADAQAMGATGEGTSGGVEDDRGSAERGGTDADSAVGENPAKEGVADMPSPEGDAE